MAALCTINTGIASCEKSFWKLSSVDEFYSLYLSVSATPKVLRILVEPFQRTPVRLNFFSIYSNLLVT